MSVNSLVVLRFSNSIEWKKAGHVRKGCDEHQTALSATETPSVIHELARRGG